MRNITIRRPITSVKDFFTLVALLLFAVAPILYFGTQGKSVLCLISFLFNGMIFVMGMHNAQKEKNLSLRTIYWIFMFFFMYFAPLIQYLLSTFPWRGSFTDGMILQINGVILLFNVFFLIGLMLADNVRALHSSKLSSAKYLSGDFEFGKPFRILFSCCVVLLAAYSFAKTGLIGIVVSRINAVKVFYSGNNSSVELIVDSVLPAFVAFVVAEAAQRFVEKKESGFRFLLLFLCMLISFFPTTLPRYKAATIYGSIFLVLFPKAKKGSNFFWIFMFGLFFAFPMLNAFRHVISRDSMQAIFEDGFFSVYTEADYDAYRMLGSSLMYCAEHGSTFGRQLLGTVLFFVPRAIWSSKPGGSGAMLIRDEMGNSVPSNVSCPFIGEGMVNFGIAGVILFALLLSIFIKAVDTNYTKTVLEKNEKIFSPYFFVLFMLFFVLRGDLLSGFAYICGFIAVGYMLKLVAKDA